MIYSCNSNQNENNNPGEQIYLNRCIACHGIDGDAGLSGASLLTQSKLKKEQIIEVLKNGRNNMPKIELQNENEFNLLAEYLISLRKP